MTPDEAARGFRFVLFDLDAGTDYFVEANGVRSALFRIDVAELPYVKRIALEYRFPAYTGLAPQTREDSGDVVAPRGTEVRVTVTPTVAVASGRLHVDGSPPEAMTVAPDGTLTAAFPVAREGFYRIELPRSDRTLQAGSPDYTIDVIVDQPPSVTLLKPGRDAKVTSIEEVFTDCGRKTTTAWPARSSCTPSTAGPRRRSCCTRAEPGRRSRPRTPSSSRS
jgi:hypothetical protein